MRAVLAIATAELRRFLRDKSNIFFVFIFPLLLVLVIGSQFGGSGGGGRVVLTGPDTGLSQAITTHLEEDGLSVGTADHDQALEQVARGRAAVALTVTAEAASAHDAGEPVTLELVTGSQTNAFAVQQRVRTVIDQIVLEETQLRTLVDHGVGEADATTALDRARADVAVPTLRIEDVDEIAQEFAGLGQFDLGASSQVLLFTFLTSLAGAATLIQARRLGIVARSLAAPVSPTQVLLGQAAGRYVIAVFQGLYIMLATGLLFGVDWGNPLLSGLVLVVFAAIAAGAAMVLGALLDHEGAAAGVGVGLGLVLAGLGGAMAPLEIFSDTLRQVAHITPHAWAYDAFAKIQRHDGTLVDILPELGVLAAMAAGALLLGAWALRRSVSRAL